jgi:hypothetical protein
VANGIPLGSSLLLPVCTVHCVQTPKAPAFQTTATPTPYSVDATENSEPGVYVFTVLATDEDIDENELVQYAIVSGDTTSSFSINATTGVITIVGKIDRELKDEYVLNISATDQATTPTVRCAFLPWILPC